MGFVVNLENYRPNKRNDAQKWKRALIREAVAAIGPWTLLETIDPLVDYPDPLNPPIFNFTTTNASAASGLWYQVEFQDDIGGKQVSVPEFNGDALDVADVEWIRTTSNVVFGEFGYPAPEPGEADRLQYVVDEAIPQFKSATGIDPLTIALDDPRIVLVRKAIRMFVEFDAARSQPEVLASAVDFDLIQSMSTDGYSETRRGLVQNNRMLHPWPALSALLNWILGMGTEILNDEAPSITSLGVQPRPGSALMREGFGWDPRFGPFMPPQTVWPLIPFNDS